MDLPDHAERKPETISVARCRELLGNEAEALTDDEVALIRQHAETMAYIVVEMYREHHLLSE